MPHQVIHAIDFLEHQIEEDDSLIALLKIGATYPGIADFSKCWEELDLRVEDQMKDPEDLVGSPEDFEEFGAQRILSAFLLRRDLLCSLVADQIPPLSQGS